MSTTPDPSHNARRSVLSRRSADGIRERLAEIKASSEAGSAEWRDPVGDARWLLDEVDRLRGALYECAVAAGEDTSDGAPTWPDLADWATEAVRELRRDYDDA